MDPKKQWFVGAGVALLVTTSLLAPGGQRPPTSPKLLNLYTRIIRLEDERSLGEGELERLFRHRLAEARARAALAIGRIGDKGGTVALLSAVGHDQSALVRETAAFALGEIEDAQAAPELMAVLGRGAETIEVRARAAEALGKIASLQPNAETLGKAKVEEINRLLSAQLPAPSAALSPGQKLMASLVITALIRLRSPAAVDHLARQLKSREAEVRWQAANALSRLRVPIASAVPALVEALADHDEMVRANSARALGISKDPRAVEPLVKLLGDASGQVQVNTIRALGSLADRRATQPLLSRGEGLLREYQEELKHREFILMVCCPSDQQVKQEINARTASPPRISLLLEVATALGGLKDERALPFLRQLRSVTGVGANPETEVAIAKFGDREFFSPLNQANSLPSDWRRVANLAQGLGELGSERARQMLLEFLGQVDQAQLDARAGPEILRALAKLKPDGFPLLLRRRLAAKDVIVRAAAATLLADFQSEEYLDSLVKALEQAGPDVMNDAKLAILSSLTKYPSPRAVSAAIKALEDEDHLVRRAAADLLRRLGAGDYQNRIGTVQTRHDQAFYERVSRRLGQKPTAIIYTWKGQIKLELFASDAPLTVDNFIELAKKNFFNGLTFHRVVPNFVVQGGDPRGDGEGGPGYQIRCEINSRPYRRGTVGMALSGKDTGGSQFFICHSPQPHLDGGYTAFGQVVAGMEVVDKLARGDIIEKVEVVER